MSDYGIISPHFWTGDTGRKIQQIGGAEAQVVALYLMTCRHRNALGLFYLPIQYISHETGLPIEEVSKGLAALCEAEFCAYDTHTEMVWIYNMAIWQIAESLKPGDNRVKWINQKYKDLPKNPFLKDFYDKYADIFHLEAPREYEGPSKPLGRGFQDTVQTPEGPSKGLPVSSETSEGPSKGLPTLEKSPEGPSKGIPDLEKNSEAPSKPDTDSDTDSVYLDLSKDKSATDTADLSSKPPGLQSKRPKHFTAKVGTFFKSIKSSCEKIQTLPQNGREFNPFQFVQHHCNNRAHPGAIDETLKALADHKIWSGIRGDPWGYANSIIKTKTQNWNEKEAIEIHERFKKLTIKELEVLTSGMFQRI